MILRPLSLVVTISDLTYNPLPQALASAYFLLGVAFLGWHAHMVWRQRGTGPGYPQSVARHHTNDGCAGSDADAPPRRPAGR